MIDKVRKNKIPAIFCESTVSQTPALQVARETNAAYGGVLYVDSLTEADGPVSNLLGSFYASTSETIVDALTSQ